MSKRKRMAWEDPEPLPPLEQGDSVFRCVYVHPDEQTSTTLLANTWTGQQDPSYLYRGMSQTAPETERGMVSDRNG